MRNRELVAITLIVIIVIINIVLLAPRIIHLKNKCLKRNEKRLDDKNLYTRKADCDYLKKQVIFRICNSAISAILVILFGVYVKDTRVIMVSILPIGCLILWIYVLIKKG